jgi:cytochrome c oxidase subunit 2
MPRVMQRRSSPVGRQTVIRMVIVGLIASGLGIAIGLLIHWFPVDASKQAKEIDTLWDVLLIASVPIFVLVATIVLTSVIKFRMRPGEENLDGPPIHGNTRLEVLWTAFPAVLLVSLCTYAFIVLHNTEKKPAGREVQVRVTGQQFTWSFQYNLGGKTVTTSQLFLEKDQPVKFNVVSKDVIHDFWVPAFRVKIDAVPGVVTHYRVKPTRLGTYPVVCAELCGLGHAFMRQTAHVLTKARYAAWVASQTKPAGAAAPGAAAIDPKALFTKGNGNSAPCASCHTLAEASATGTIGPNLDTGLKGKTPAFIRQSIVTPDAVITPGFAKGIMPANFGDTLSKPELDALVKFLSTVASKP